MIHSLYVLPDIRECVVRAHTYRRIAGLHFSG